MIAKDKGLRKVCRNYEMVENYYKAIADEENKWHLHHRREIDEMKSRQQLIDEGKYYDVNSEELIFLTESEHNSLHNKGKIISEETKKKLSKSLKGKMTGEKNPMYGRKGETAPAFGRTGDKHPMYGMCGEKNPFYGRRHSEEVKNKLSEMNKGENHPQFGWHWWNNGKVAIKSKEQPGPGFVRGRLK